MQQNATGGENERADLPPQQTLVLAALLTGATITAAAEVAEVDRTTVHRWLREDFAFQAVLNAAQRDLRREVASRLDHVVQAAVETISAAVESGDVRAALAVLRGTGVLAGDRPRIGPEDPDEVAQEAEVSKMERDAQRAQRRMMTF